MSFAPSPSRSHSPSWAPSPVVPRPLGAEAPPTCEVPHFAPVRVRGGRYPLQRLVRHRRRAVAAGLTVTAAAVLAAGPAVPQETEQARGRPVADPVREHRAVRLVTAPVRIADGATVGLLRPGDRVDVIAAERTATGGGARVVARGARVTKVPQALETPGGAEGGALVVLSVPRSTAARLAGASTTARLAVTLC
ncbi:RcpC/CpaB family pilus assembly protein [Streptomyces sp. NPDC006332]|uniref:RcpC/CpaB family pilus assembly protein n=1 Tax=Streptomyces sp. NPDC006332 TaxID=3155456 RepID=UPI0033A1B79C